MDEDTRLWFSLAGASDLDAEETEDAGLDAAEEGAFVSAASDDTSESSLSEEGSESSGSEETLLSYELVWEISGISAYTLELSPESVLHPATVRAVMHARSNAKSFFIKILLAVAYSIILQYNTTVRREKHLYLVNLVDFFDKI